MGTTRSVDEEEEKEYTEHDTNRESSFQNYQGMDQNRKEQKLTVCVTGASGFIGSHCIQLLLSKGYNVHGTVRGDPGNDRYQWLHQLCLHDDAPASSAAASSTSGDFGKLTLFQADLLQAGSFDAAIRDCHFVFHVANPVKLNITDWEKDMLQPTKEGTLNVLDSCLRANHLKRVILTGTLYSVVGNPKKGRIYDENDWQTDYSLAAQPYAFSKRESEQEAWKWMNQHEADVSFDLITLLPSLVIGKQLDQTSRFTASNTVMYRFLKGAYGRLNASIPFLDVRDCAAAHLFFIDDERAIEQAQGRYIVHSETLSFDAIRECVSNYAHARNMTRPPPFDSCCKTCCKCDCMFCGMCCMPCILCCCVPSYQKRYMQANINKGTKIASQEKIKALGFQFRAADTALFYLFEYFAQQNVIFMPVSHSVV